MFIHLHYIILTYLWVCILILVSLSTRVSNDNFTQLLLFFIWSSCDFIIQHPHKKENQFVADAIIQQQKLIRCWHCNLTAKTDTTIRQWTPIRCWHHNSAAKTYSLWTSKLLMKIESLPTQKSSTQPLSLSI